MPSFGGFRYYLSFVDAYSRFTWIYPLKTKADTFTVFKQFETMVELQYDNPLKALQTDWGEEFRAINKFLRVGDHSQTCLSSHTSPKWCGREEASSRCGVRSHS